MMKQDDSQEDHISYDFLTHCAILTNSLPMLTSVCRYCNLAPGTVPSSETSSTTSSQSSINYLLPSTN